MTGCYHADVQQDVAINICLHIGEGAQRAAEVRQRGYLGIKRIVPGLMKFGFLMLLNLIIVPVFLFSCIF